MSSQNRREFLKLSAGSLAAASVSLAATKVSARVLGANDRVRVAVVGVSGRGQAHLGAYCSMKDNVEIAYIVDVDKRLWESRAKSVEERAGYRPKCVVDLREVLNDPNLDAVSIATPNHTHALLSIWACQAGKDVYVEKPCSHNIFEGRKLVEAARKYDRIVQQGSQSRSDQNWQQTIAALHSGKYGKLQIVYGYSSKPRPTIGFKMTKQPPEELNFYLWLGPAPVQPYHENLVHYNWHWFWDFGNGEIGNQGVHQMDIARWALPDGAAPKSVISLGGRYGYQTQDQGQTPNTQLTVIDCGEAKIIFEDRGLVDGKTQKVINEFVTDEGVIKNGKFFRNGQGEGEPLEKPPVGFPGSEPQHFRNFIECVRSRKREDLAAEILEGHLSSALCHLGNISYRLGTEVPFSQEMKALGDDQAALEAFESMKQHLIDAAYLKLEHCTYRLGRKLEYDAQAEKFVGDDEANQLLTRPYREPFVVPNEV